MAKIVVGMNYCVSALNKASVSTEPDNPASLSFSSLKAQDSTPTSASLLVSFTMSSSLGFYFVRHNWLKRGSGSGKQRDVLLLSISLLTRCIVQMEARALAQKLWPDDETVCPWADIRILMEKDAMTEHESGVIGEIGEMIKAINA